jgi:hypothetical protein
MAPSVLAQQTIALGAPKWDAGDQWTWQIGNDQITWTVLSAGGEYVVQEKSARESGVFRVAADFSSTSASFIYFLPQFYELQFPLALGKAWTSTKRVNVRGVRGSPPGPSDVEVTRIPEGVVSIAVPGGTFEAVRIFGRAHALDPRMGSPYAGFTQGEAPANISGTPTITGDFITWYAPQVKQMVKITWQASRRFWPAQYEGTSLLLVSYKLHNP